MPLSNAIFISYRRSDSNDVTGRIYDRLSEHFGPDVVFWDVNTIPHGEDFRTYLNQGVGRCQVAIAVIGPTWLEVLNQRLGDPVDWVRAELEMALKRTIPVIPLLVGGARPLNADELPVGLKELAPRNCVQARSGSDFHPDMDRLIQSLEKIVGLPAVVQGLNSNAPFVVNRVAPRLGQVERLILETKQEDLAAKRQQYDSVAETFRDILDPEMGKKLSRKLKKLAGEMHDIEQEIAQLQGGQGDP